MNPDRIEEEALKLYLKVLMEEEKLLRPGDQILGYVVNEMIGAGGCGQVYKVEKNGKPFALKILANEEMAKKEESLLAELDSIQGVPDFIERGSHPFEHHSFESLGIKEAHLHFVVQKLVIDGNPILERSSSWPPQKVVDRFHNLCELVGQLHRKNVVHGDLKPGNILVDDGGQSWIIDLGFSAIYGGVPVAAEGFTKKYASPEQIRGGCFTHQSDIFSLGVILCELLCRRIPRDMDQPEFPPLAANAFLGEETLKFCSVIDTCLANEPNKRFERMANLIEKLREVEQATIEGSEEEILVGGGQAKSVDSGKGGSSKDKKKFEKMFPESPGIAIRRELNRLLENEGLVEIAREVGLMDVSANRIKEDPFEDRDLGSVIDAISSLVSRIGKEERLRVLLGDFLGGLLVLSVSNHWTEEERTRVISEAVRIGKLAPHPGEGEVFLSLVNIYQAAIVGKLCRANEIFEKDGTYEIGSPEEIPEGITAGAKREAALKILASKVFPKSNVDDLTEVRQREIAAKVGREFEKGRGFYSLDQRWLELIPILDGEEAFKHVLFFETSGDHEEFIPGYYNTILALYDLMQNLNLISS